MSILRSLQAANRHLERAIWCVDGGDNHQAPELTKRDIIDVLREINRTIDYLLNAETAASRLQ